MHGGNDMIVAMMQCRRLMSRGRVATRQFRALAACMVAVLLLVGSASTSLAEEGDQGEGEPQESSSQPADAPPGDNPEADRKAYLTLLFEDINIGRDRAPTPRYEYMSDRGSEAVDEYLQDLLPAMKEADACFHGSDQPGMQ